MMRTHQLLLAALCVAAPSHVAFAQARTDTIYLDALQRAAQATDRRAAQMEVIAAQSALRLANIKSEHLPTINATGSAQYLSDVPNIGARLPGSSIPSPAKDQYDGYVSVRQSLLDPTRKSRVAVEQAQMAESQSRVRAAVWQQRAQVNDAFFGILLRDSQAASIDAAIAELAERRKAAATRVSAGTALQSEVLMLDAELARRAQSREELKLESQAMRDVLAELTGQPIPASAVLSAGRVESVSLPSAISVDSARARPEYAQFDRTRDVLKAREQATAAQDQPRISLFGRGGYGRPGLNALGRSFDTYFTAGVQVDWSLWNWGRTHRELEVQQLQSKMIASDEAAFTESLQRAAIADAGRIAAIEHSLTVDDSIIALRERVLRETRLRHDEGDVTSADYVARLSELLSAQLDRATRRVRLAEARARYLTTLGRDIQ